MIADLLPTTDPLGVEVPDPHNEALSETEFHQQVDVAWQVCDRFDLETDIWRGRILRAVRDREKRGASPNSLGFLNWLKDRDITKSQAYGLIELADSADVLVAEGAIDPESFKRFSKRAFIETAKAAPEVQQAIGAAARQGETIARREVRQLADEWAAMSSPWLPEEIKEKAATHTIPPRYLAPLAREMEKLPDTHRAALQDAIAETADIDGLKQVTLEARQLAKYLETSAQVRALAEADIDCDRALDEALRLGVLQTAADLMACAAQIEQTAAKLYAVWKRARRLADRLYLDTGASTPHLRDMLASLETLTGEIVRLQLSSTESTRAIALHVREADLESARYLRE